MEVKNKQQGIKVVADVLDIVGGKWRGQILAHLCDNPKRFIFNFDKRIALFGRNQNSGKKNHSRNANNN